MKKLFQVVLVLIVSVFYVSCATKKPKKSVEDLKTAFNIESTDAQKYAKFALRATSEGYDTIAGLFDAVSKSAIIHASNHLKVLEKFGEHGTVAQIGSFEVKTTPENLKAALGNETFEMQTQYPGFIRDAENEQAAEAAKSFTLAWGAEKKHLGYFRTAATCIESGNEKGCPLNWYVCPACGNIYNPTDLKERCEFCLTNQSEFIGFTEKQE